MKQLREQIKREIHRLMEEKYPLPQELVDALKHDLKQDANLFTDTGKSFRNKPNHLKPHDLAEDVQTQTHTQCRRTAQRWRFSQSIGQIGLQVKQTDSTGLPAEP